MPGGGIKCWTKKRPNLGPRGADYLVEETINPLATNESKTEIVPDAPKENCINHESLLLKKKKKEEKFAWVGGWQWEGDQTKEGLVGPREGRGLPLSPKTMRSHSRLSSGVLRVGMVNQTGWREAGYDATVQVRGKVDTEDGEK